MMIDDWREIENPEPDSVTTFLPKDAPTMGESDINLGALNENRRNILSVLPSIETTASRKMLIPLFTLQNIEDSLDQTDLMHAEPPMRARTVGSAIPRPSPNNVTETEPVVGRFKLVAPLTTFVEYKKEVVTEPEFTPAVAKIMTFLEYPEGKRLRILESDCQTVADEDVCPERARCEKDERPKEAPKTVKDMAPVVAMNAGDQLAMIGMAYEAKNDALPESKLAVTDTGRVAPTPETNMADTDESDTH